MVRLIVRYFPYQVDERSRCCGTKPRPCAEAGHQGVFLSYRFNLTWSPYLKCKRKSGNSRFNPLCPLILSKLTMTCKLVIYKAIIRTIFVNEIHYPSIQVWGSAKPLNIKTLQAFQSISLRSPLHGLYSK